MGQIESLIFLLGAAALLAQLARVLRVPYPVFLVLGGLLIGFVPGLPTVEISPEVIFLVFLPPLLNYAAFFSSPRDLRRHLGSLLALAIGLVLFTTVAIALIAHALIGLPWAAAFVLGAILAPTDPVAAEAIFRRLGVPGRVSTIGGGEGLGHGGTGAGRGRAAGGAGGAGVGRQVGGGGGAGQRGYGASRLPARGRRGSYGGVLGVGGGAGLPPGRRGRYRPGPDPRLGRLAPVEACDGHLHLHCALGAYALR